MLEEPLGFVRANWMEPLSVCGIPSPEDADSRLPVITKPTHRRQQAEEIGRFLTTLPKLLDPALPEAVIPLFGLSYMDQYFIYNI